MVTRRSVIAAGGAAAMVAAGVADHIAIEAKKKKKRKVVTRVFSNSNAITTTNAGGQATPYPSSITVSGLRKGSIQKIRVLLNGFTTDAPDDFDVMLSAQHLPGLTAILMSDVGGAAAVSNADLVLDDDAAASLPFDGEPPITSGTYKPTDDTSGGADAFPAPAPTPNGNTALSVFNGTNPNGEWQLWVTDKNGNGPGSFSRGWGIEITAKVKKKKKKK